MASHKKPVREPSRIDIVFDDLEHAVDRAERLLSKVIVGIALLALLVFEIMVVARVLSNGH